MELIVLILPPLFTTEIVFTGFIGFTKVGVKLKPYLYVVKESGQFSCREFRCLNLRFFLLKIVVFVFLVIVV